MWFILRPLIFYLESLVFRYIPLARGDVWEKKRGSRGVGGWGLASSLPVQNMWWSVLVRLRFPEENGGANSALSASASPALYYSKTCWSLAWAPMQQWPILASPCSVLRQVTSNLLLYSLGSSYSFLSHINSGAKSEVSICPVPNECQWY